MDTTFRRGSKQKLYDSESCSHVPRLTENVLPVHEPCSLMTEAEEETLRELHCFLIENFDPLYVLGFMYQEKIIDCTLYDEIQDNPVSTSRAERLCLKLHTLCSFRNFLSVLMFQESYTYLVPILEEKLNQVQDRKAAKGIPWYLKMEKQIPRIGVFSKRREAIIKLRHTMKQLTLDGKLDQFNEIRRKLIQLYDHNEKLRSRSSCRVPDNQTLISKDELRMESRSQVLNNQMRNFDGRSLSRTECNISENRMTKCADLLFIALDAEVEHRRIRFDTTWKSDSHFRKMKEVIRNTSNPKLMTTLYLARKGSTHVMCGGQLNEGLSLVQQVKENGERLMPCRETGIVLLVEFNLLCQRYEKSHSPSLKENLLKVISESIDHFEDEQEYVRDDFRLIIRLKASFIYLGIGLFCDILSIPVSDDERKHGESCLNEVEKNWNQLQIRWKMIWYFAKARVKQMDGFYEFAATLLAKALDIAGENNFTRELQNIVKFREHCNEKLIEHSNKQDNIRQNIVESCLNEFFDE